MYGAGASGPAACCPLGSVHLVSLAEAREQALANRKLACSGDPLAERRRAQGMPTFAEGRRPARSSRSVPAAATPNSPGA